MLLLREQPGLRVLIVEKSAAFTRRVGEATVEVSGYFLSRVLGLTQHLNEAHLVKQGMRFWFFNDETKALDQCSEIGGRYLARVPAYQVDRAVLDEEVLRRARALGAELSRPASVGKIQLTPGGLQTVEVRGSEQNEQVQARWVVDASGIAAVLARQDGWWAWCIPLKGGDVSIGVVFDQRRVRWPEDGPLGERLKNFLSQHPAAREILSAAHWREGDVHWRKNLPYCSTTFAGDGFVLVGDASAFLDPLYSPGMDWISFTVSSAARLILLQQRGEDVAPLMSKHNRDFALSYHRWFAALYRDKYEYLGEYDLLRLAFLLDLGLYYLGVASQPFKRGKMALCEPVFASRRSTPFYVLMRSYNRRFAEMARSRRKRARLGRRNAGRRFMFRGYTFARSSALPILAALGGWARLEFTEGWRSWWHQSVAAE